MIPIRGLRAPVEQRATDGCRSRFRTVQSRPRTYWTSDLDARLAEMWASEASARMIAFELGGFSLYAVIGRAHRVVLTRRANPVVVRV